MTTATAWQGRVYPGWRTVAAMLLVSAALAGVAISAFVMFAVPFEAEFGWSAADTGTLVSAMWLTGPLALPLGPLAPRLGAWRMVIAGMVIQAVALVLAAFVQTYPQMVAVRVAMGIGLVVMVPAGPVIIAQWFRRRFSTAMAIVWSAAAAGQIILGPLTVWLDETVGWRTAMVVLAAVLIGVLAIALWLGFGGRTPEQLGVDVAAVEGTETSDEGALTEAARPAPATGMRSIDRRAALVMSLAAAGAGIATLALQSQAPLFLGALGMTQAVAAWQLSLFSALALAGVLVSGWLLDRAPLPLSSLSVTATVFIGAAMLWVLAVGGGGAGTAALGMILLGYGLGAGEIMWITLFKRQFGSAAFGATYGLFYCCFQLGMAAGGYIGGLALESWGAKGFVAVFALSYAAPAIFSAWRPGRMVEPGPAVSRSPA